MLAIRLKRTGRKGHAQYRVIAQDSHRSPMSGKVAAYLGSYDPHAKTVSLDKEKIEFYLSNGAQPTNRVVRILKAEGVTLPKWVKFDDTAEGKLKNPEKLRKNQPEEPKEEAPAEEPTAESEAPADEAAAPEAEAEKTEETPAEEAPAEEAEKSDEAAEEAPADEPAEAEEEAKE